MFKIFKLPELRKKIVFTIFIIVVFRLLAHIPVPGVDTSSIKAYLEQSVFFGFFDLFSGGGFQNFSIVTLGLGPYINASIIMQLLTMLVPSLEELAKEGEYGSAKCHENPHHAQAFDRGIMQIVFNRHVVNNSCTKLHGNRLWRCRFI